jgi:hypothetical protein
MAQYQAPSETAAASPSEFVKVEGGGPDRTSAEGTVIVAYMLMLAIMFVFVWRTFRVQTTLLAEAERLRTATNEGAKDAGR